MRGLLNEQRRKLEQKYPYSIRRSKRIVWINDAVDEDTDDVVRVFLVGSRRSADQALPLVALEGN